MNSSKSVDVLYNLYSEASYEEKKTVNWNYHII